MEEGKGIAVGSATGLDVGDNYSHYCIVGTDGAIREEGRIRTTPKALEEHFAPLEPSRIALEVGTHSPWISRVLRGLGHEVYVANASRLGLIYGRPRKNDRADAEALARLARLDPRLLAPVRHRGEQFSDGSADLVAASYYSNSVSVLLGIGNGTFRPKVDLGVGSSPAGAALGDFSGDGLSDIVTANAGGTISVLLNRLPLTAVETSTPNRGALWLGQNRPNPFNPRTTISYELAGFDHVQLVIFDVHGQAVRTLVDSGRPPGRHAVAWDGTDSRGRPVGSGVYFYRLQTSRETESRRMVLIR